jgi:hypothetical protein
VSESPPPSTAPVPAVPEDEAELERSLLLWRTLALTSWSDAVAAGRYDEDGTLLRDETGRLHAEIAALHSTLSWRVTRPLRLGRSVVARLRARR